MLQLSTYLKSGLTVNNIGFSTVQNLLIGTGSSTGTVSQPLQVSGGGYFSGSVGINTTNPQGPLQVGAGSSSFIVSGIGSIGIGTTTTNSALDLLGILGIQGTVTAISTTTAATIDSISLSLYRSARFQVQITQGTNYQSTDLMTIHDGTTSNLIEYGTISTGDYLASFSSTISGSNLLLRATMGSAGIATVKVARYGVTI